MENSEDSSIRHSLNALLYQTGTPSRKFMLVLATNRPHDLDAAILDRVDVSINIGLPKIQERRELVILYMRLHVLSLMNEREKKPVRIEEDCHSEDAVDEIADTIDGFSGRQIAKMMIAMRYAVTMSEDLALTVDMMTQVVQSKVDEYREKMGFTLIRQELDSPRRSKTAGLAGQRSGVGSTGKLNELDLKLARRMNLNGEKNPNIVQLNL